MVKIVRIIIEFLRVLCMYVCWWLQKGGQLSAVEAELSKLSLDGDHHNTVLAETIQRQGTEHREHVTGYMSHSVPTCVY